MNNKNALKSGLAGDLGNQVPPLLTPAQLILRSGALRTQVSAFSLQHDFEVLFRTEHIPDSVPHLQDKSLAYFENT